MLRVIDKTLVTIPSKSKFLKWFQMAANESISVLYATSPQQCCESSWPGRPRPLAHIYLSVGQWENGEKGARRKKTYGLKLIKVTYRLLSWANQLILCGSSTGCSLFQSLSWKALRVDMTGRQAVTTFCFPFLDGRWKKKCVSC